MPVLKGALKGAKIELFVQHFVVDCLYLRHCILTVWKFHDFSITQILREINLEDSRSAKSPILSH